MKAVQFAQYGGPEVLQLVDVEEPTAGPGQVRIKVRAAGVNGMDWKIRAGFMAGGQSLEKPSGTGFDASGVVDQVGEGVTKAAVGDAVFGFGSATYAEYAVLDQWIAKPESLSFEEAAGYSISVETAVRILDEVDIRAGQTLLVSGASGGVGSAVVQLAKARGIDVIGTASEGNQEYLRSLGATPTTYGDGLAERVKALAPNGVDAAFDISGSGVIPELIAIVGEPTKVVSIADPSAAEHGARLSFSAADRISALNEAVRLHTEGKFHLPVSTTFSLEEAQKAQEINAAGHATGRTVIAL